MSHGMTIFSNQIKGNIDTSENQNEKGVKQLVDNGIQTIPKNYILPPSERPDINNSEDSNVAKQNLQLPIIDFSNLFGPNRPHVLKSLANACEQYGFFQVSNKTISLIQTPLEKNIVSVLCVKQTKIIMF